MRVTSTVHQRPRLWWHYNSHAEPAPPGRGSTHGPRPTPEPCLPRHLAVATCCPIRRPDGQAGVYTRPLPNAAIRSPGGGGASGRATRHHGTTHAHRSMTTDRHFRGKPETQNGRRGPAARSPAPAGRPRPWPRPGGRCALRANQLAARVTPSRGHDSGWR